MRDARIGWTILTDRVRLLAVTRVPALDARFRAAGDDVRELDSSNQGQQRRHNQQARKPDLMLVSYHPLQALGTQESRFPPLPRGGLWGMWGGDSLALLWPIDAACVSRSTERRS